MKTKKRTQMSGPVHTLTFNSKVLKKDEAIIQLVNELAVIEDLDPKPALSRWIKRNLPDEIARLRSEKQAG